MGGADINDFVTQATGIVTIPTAGDWTFGVNSDEGFRVTISGPVDQRHPDDADVRVPRPAHPGQHAPDDQFPDGRAIHPAPAHLRPRRRHRGRAVRRAGRQGRVRLQLPVGRRHRPRRVGRGPMDPGEHYRRRRRRAGQFGRAGVGVPDDHADGQLHEHRRRRRHALLHRRGGPGQRGQRDVPRPGHRHQRRRFRGSGQVRRLHPGLRQLDLRRQQRRGLPPDPDERQPGVVQPDVHHQLRRPADSRRHARHVQHPRGRRLQPRPGLLRSRRRRRAGTLRRARRVRRLGFRRHQLAPGGRHCPRRPGVLGPRASRHAID